VAEIRSYVDSDHVFAVWQLDAPIPDCRGFALKRKATASGEATILDTFVGFAGDTAPPGTRRPSTEWPIQRFMWSDYASPREEVEYEAVPMIGDKGHLVEDTANAIGWSDPVTITPDVGDGISAFFNRGIVATQWLSRALRERGGATRAVLTDASSTTSSSSSPAAARMPSGRAARTGRSQRLHAVEQRSADRERGDRALVPRAMGRARQRGSEYPDELFRANDVERTTDLAESASAQAWFAPVRGTVDLESARKRINEAKQGILFLMFNPGPVGTLLNDIVARTTSASPTYTPTYTSTASSTRIRARRSTPSSGCCTAVT